MELLGIKNFKRDENSLSMTMCRTCKTCPDVRITKDSDEVMLGGEDEGYSYWTKQQFTDMINAAKEGLFDDFLLRE